MRNNRSNSLAGLGFAARPGSPFAVVDPVPGFGRRERERPARPAIPLASRAATVPEARALREQDALLRRADRALSGPRSTVVVIGARGRGKSALAGRLHALLRARDPRTPILVTAPVRSAIASLARHAGAPVRFVAPDAALRAEPATLFVDEAATLPAALLGALAARHDRLVLTTTVSGHEPAGRAFAVRLDRLLGPARRDPLVLVPQRPMRWGAQDPLEGALADALLLDAMAAGAGSPGPGAAEGVRHALARGAAPELGRVAPAALRAAPGTLREIVRLLAATHYQSALADVDHLLRGAFEAHVARLDGELVGVALVACEGGIDPGLAPDVLGGRRRLPDQLLPQLLARAASDAAALPARYARVVRIAVAPGARRAGVGSALLGGLGAGADAVGASFAAEPGATRFWLANGYRIFHEGGRVNPRSGLASRSVLRAVGADPSAGSVPDPTPFPASRDALRATARDLVRGIRVASAAKAARAAPERRSAGPTTSRTADARHTPRGAGTTPPRC